MLQAGTAAPTRRSTRVSKPAVFFNPSSVSVPSTPAQRGGKSRATPSLKQIASGKSSEESAESSASSDSESLVGNCDSYSTDDAPLSSLSPSMAKKTPKRGAAEVLVVDDDDDAGEEEHPLPRRLRAVLVALPVILPGLRDPPDDVRSIVQPSPPPGKVTVVVDLKEYKCSIDLKWMEKVNFPVRMKKAPERETMFSYKSAREVVEMYAHLAGSQTPVLHGFTPELVRHPAFFSTFPGKWLIDLGQTVEDLVQKWHECHIDRRAFRHQCPQLIPLDPLLPTPWIPLILTRTILAHFPLRKPPIPYPPFDPSKSLSMEQYDADYQAHLQLEQAHDEAQRKLVEEARAKYRADNLAWMARNKSRKEEFIADHKRKSALIEEYNEFRQHALSHLDMALNTVGIFISIVAQAEFERLSGGPSPFGSPAISVALPENPQPPKISKLKALAFPGWDLLERNRRGGLSQYDGAKWHAENPLFNRWAPPPIPDVPVTRGLRIRRKATRFLQGSVRTSFSRNPSKIASVLTAARSVLNASSAKSPAFASLTGTPSSRPSATFAAPTQRSCVPVPFPASFVVTDRGKAQIEREMAGFPIERVDRRLGLHIKRRIARDTSFCYHRLDPAQLWGAAAQAARARKPALLRFAPDTHDGNPTVDGDGDVNMYGGEEQTGNGGGRKDFGSAVDEEDFFEEDHAGHGDEYSFDPASPIRVANPYPSTFTSSPYGILFVSFGERARSFATGSISVGPSVPNSIYGPNFSGPPRSGGGEGSSGGAALPSLETNWRGARRQTFSVALSSRTASSSGNFGNGDQRVEHGTTGDPPSSADGPYGHPPDCSYAQRQPGDFEFLTRDIVFVSSFFSWLVYCCVLELPSGGLG
ncbi:hypothetical protein DFH06DRAFT_1124270 [Mycena polygramma]|nr:hypothetical protein DFH06DRAFT_1124270 [Mycena polygramma]